MTWLADFNADFQRFTGARRNQGRFDALLKILGEPGLIFAFLMRLQIALEQKQHQRIARVIHLLNLRLTGAEIGHNCDIGAGIVVKHPLGLVLGGGSVVGRNCTFLRNVTLGERNPDMESNSGRLYPTLGENCMVGTGATILGPVTIGDDVKIGAHALVLKDAPSGVTIVGVPGQAVQRP